MESLQELLASLEDAKTLGRTVLKEVLVKVVQNSCFAV